jgi:hypothetical protein
VPRTFAWFEGRKRPPSEYEELTYGLHFGEEGLTHTALGTWTQDNTRLTNVPWETFVDPSQLHYRTWVATQDKAERELGGALALAASGGFVDGLEPGWRQRMAALVGGLAFAEWGVAMTMQYVQRFTLSSSVAQSAQLQVCDELRHAQRSLEWSDQLARPPAAGAGESEAEGDLARDTWLREPALQPLRRAVEVALTISDWSEVIVAVDLVLEGLLQPFQRELLMAAGRAERDMATAMLGRHCWIDEDRHVAWAEAFIRLAIESEAANRDIVQSWCDAHLPAANEALDALVGGFGFDGAAETAAAVARTEWAKRLEGLGLDTDQWRQS